MRLTAVHPRIAHSSAGLSTYTNPKRKRGVRLRAPRLRFGLVWLGGHALEQRSKLPALLVILCLAATVSCGRKSAPSPELASNGDTEVTAKLTSIGGDFPPNKLYDYMYV